MKSEIIKTIDKFECAAGKVFLDKMKNSLYNYYVTWEYLCEPMEHQGFNTLQMAQMLFLDKSAILMNRSEVI